MLKQWQKALQNLSASNVIINHHRIWENVQIAVLGAVWWKRLLVQEVKNG